jgi:hypothetical protein
MPKVRKLLKAKRVIRARRVNKVNKNKRMKGIQPRNKCHKIENQIQEIVK